MLAPNKNAALHAFDILMTRFMADIHQYSVEFVKSYKIRASIGENTIKFLITDLSIFRRKIGKTESDDGKSGNDRKGGKRKKREKIGSQDTNQNRYCQYINDEKLRMESLTGHYDSFMKNARKEKKRSPKNDKARWKRALCR